MRFEELPSELGVLRGQNFSNGNAILDHWFALGQTHPGLCESELKLIPIGAAHSNNGKTKGGKKRSRAKDHQNDMEKEKLKMARSERLLVTMETAAKAKEAGVVMDAATCKVIQDLMSSTFGEFASHDPEYLWNRTLGGTK